MKKFIIAIATVGLTLTACGDSESGPSADTPLSDLTVEEATAECNAAMEATADLVSDDDMKKITCVGTTMASAPASADDCQTTLDECLAAEPEEAPETTEEPVEEEDPCADVAAPPSTCTATVGDMRTCLDDMLQPTTDWVATYVALTCTDIAAIVAGTQDAPPAVPADVVSTSCDAVNAASCQL
ncbi:MAG: hypothetical protein QF464_01290 [Myxococcota bacterium]|nr:hypothetical protein [Myxococcota bacterium]